MHNIYSSNRKRNYKIDKNGEKNIKNISYILQFIDRARFMANSVSNLSIIFMKEFIELNVNTEMIIKNGQLVELNISIVTIYLSTQILKII